MSSYPQFNLKTLHGVCGFSVFSGLLLAIQIHTGFDISETGIIYMIFQAFQSIIGPPYPYIDFIFFVIITISEIIVTALAIFQIAEHRWVGAFVSGSGFFGILSTTLGTWASSQFFMIFGVILIISGFFVASLRD